MIVANKSLLISTEAELADEYRNIVFAETRLPQLSITRDPETVNLNLDGKELQFEVFYRLAPNNVNIEELKKAKHPLVVLPSVKEQNLQDWVTKGLNVADLTGRLFLQRKGVLVSLPTIEGRRARYHNDPGTIYSGKSGRVVRLLLNHPLHGWRLSDLSLKSGASPGLVSRILSYLARSRIIEKDKDARFRTIRPELLLKAWAEEDRFAKRTQIFRYAGGDGSPLDTAKALQASLSHGKLPFAFTQAIAGWLRVPYTEPQSVALYISELPSQAVLQQCSLRPVSEAGRVHFILPDDHGVFQELQTPQGLRSVCDPQIYVDLQRAGQRGQEQADALLNSPQFWSR